MKRYAAIARHGTYNVAREHNGEWLPIFNIKNFKTFEEADQVAKDCAQGKYDQHPGEYINMR
jgi:hypothetical protein